jgi:diaminopimelate epimerase
MNLIPFWKLQSIGNDFPVFHIDDLVSEGRDIDDFLKRLAVQASDRKFGIGGDGILAIRMEESDLRLRMFNPDGTEDFCGNGIRCAARHAFDLGWVGPGFTVKHLDRNIATTIEEERISTIIGFADYTPEKVPHKNGELFNETVWSGMDSGMPLSLFGSALTTGSTHVVIPTSVLPEDDSFRSISARIEVDPLFPNRTSVIWSKEIAPMKLQIRIWERAVGETLGCGTGSSAAAVDYLRRKRAGGTVEVVNPGGSVFVSMDAWNAPITVVGQAEAVYSGTFGFDG